MHAENIHIVGIDSGGTFTDFVYYNGESLTSCKVLSTPQSPETAIITGLKQLGVPLNASDIIHGSTVATNAVLEGKGARVAFITNRGFADMLTIGRQTRRQLYALEPQPAPVAVASELCFEVDVRIDADGHTITALKPEQLVLLAEQIKAAKVESVAINLLFSFIDNRDEKAIAQALPDHLFVSCSSDVLAEYKEYERGVSTWLNAFVSPVIKRYLNKLRDLLPASTISIMQSSGGTCAIEHCADHGVQLLLSGPAAGLAAARHIAKQCDITRILSLDMGGTSTDVALVDGELQLTSEGHIGSYPVAVSMVDIHTIGAGGGSIAWIDDGGLLQVGPQSAGAAPGPACYGRGGEQATITDANLILGRLPRHTRLAGGMALDYDAAIKALQPLSERLKLSIEDTAAGIVAIAEEHMSNALRKISIQRGHDARQFALASFGGAGGLHVCALAESLAMREAIIPLYAGVLSAFGMLVAPKKFQLSRTLTAASAGNDDAIDNAFNELAALACQELSKQGLAQHEITQQRSVDMRYRGQSFTLNVDWQGLIQSTSLFQQQHLQRYAHQLDHEVELVTIRVMASGPEPQLSIQPPQVKPAPTDTSAYSRIYRISERVPVYQRQQLDQQSLIHGPAIICEAITTCYIAAGWQARIDQHNNLRLTHSAPDCR